MTLQEACQRLGKSETTLRRWIKTGKLKAELVEGKYEIDPDEIERLVDDYAVAENAQSVEADLRQEEMTRQMTRQEEEIEFLRRELSEQSKRHDLIVMQFSQQLSRAYLQLEDQRRRKMPLLRRIFRWT
jgi:excisionase family DNA binding protein